MSHETALTIVWIAFGIIGLLAVYVALTWKDKEPP